MGVYLKIVDKINRFNLILIGALLLSMFIIIFTQVIARYIFSSPIYWSEELARYLMIYTILIGSSLALRSKRLIAVTVISQMLSIKSQRILLIVTHIIMLVFFIELIHQGYQILGRVETQSAPTLNLSMSVPYGTIIVGGVLLFINTIAVIFEAILEKGADVK